ncbi:MAG: response regulator [Bdellovibrionales bacterium]|nr:response regulator [Bdellovibrionales bacterium]
MTEKPHVLLVDDHRGQRLILRTLLQSEGYDCLEADSGAEALQLLEVPHRIGLVICDLNMPGMSGTKCIEAIRGNAENRDIRTILLTATQTELLDADTRCADAICDKTKIRSELLEQVRRLFQS